MTVDTEIDPDATCPECGSETVLPRRPNSSTSYSILGSIPGFGGRRRSTSGYQYEYYEYECNECGHVFLPGEGDDSTETVRRLSGFPDSLSHSDTVSISLPDGEIESSIVATGVRINISIGAERYVFDDQVVLNEPIENNRPAVVFSDEGPIGLAWASSETHSVVTPFP